MLAYNLTEGMIMTEKMKDKQLEVQFAAIRKAWDNLKTNEADWPTLVMALAKQLRALRSAAKDDDVLFGKWLKENDLDDIPKDDRAAYVNLAQHEKEAMQALQATESRSVRIVWDQLDAKLHPEKPKSKRAMAAKAAKEARKTKGRTPSSQLYEAQRKVAADTEQEDDEFAPYFAVAIRPELPKEVKHWLEEIVTELEKHEAHGKSFKVTWA